MQHNNKLIHDVSTDIYGLKVPAFGTIWSGDDSHFNNLTLSLPAYDEFITDLLIGTVEEIDYIW